MTSVRVIQLSHRANGVSEPSRQANLIFSSLFSDGFVWRDLLRNTQSAPCNTVLLLRIEPSFAPFEAWKIDKVHVFYEDTKSASGYVSRGQAVATFSSLEKPQTFIWVEGFKAKTLHMFPDS